MDADDAAQETFARALATPRRPDETRPWLAGVLRNVVRRGARDAVRRTAREARVARAEALPATADFVAREQILRRVADAVLALDEPQRVVVLLRHYEGLPPREIATRLGTPVETVKSRLKRAHEQLRETLDEGRRGNVEGWRSALGGLVGLAPDGTPLAGGTAGGPAGVGTGRAAGGAAKGGTVVASKTVVVAAVAAFVLGLGGVLVWKAPWRADDDRSSPTAASHESAGRFADDRAPALAAPPRAVGDVGAPASSPVDASSPAAATGAAGPAAGWKRWTVGTIQLDTPETWTSTDDAHATDQRGWSTGERPWPNATFRLARSGTESQERLLADADVVSDERVRVAGSTAFLRIVEPRKGPPGVQLRALLVSIDAPFGEGRPLSFFAVSTREKFAEFEPTYRAILATVRAVESGSATGDEVPSAATLRSYEGVTPADVLEGVVLLGDMPLPGGQATLRIGSETRTATIGADGRFRFDGVPATALGSRLAVEPRDVARREVVDAWTTPTGTHQRVILALGRSSVEGRVFDRDGRPVVGASVRVDRNGHMPSTLFADNSVVTITNDDGAYRADHLLPGSYFVLVPAPGERTREGLVEVGGATPIRFDVGSPTPESSLSGVVRGAGGAVPGPGSLMFNESTPGKASMVVAAYDSEGRYSVRLPAGTYLVRIQPPAPARSILLDGTVVVATGASTRDLALPDGRIRGRLVDPATRRPVERGSIGRKPWQICLQRVAASVINSDLCAEVADDGTFGFEFVPPGNYTVVSFAPLAPCADGKPRVIEVLGGGAITDVELELQAK